MNTTLFLKIVFQISDFRISNKNPAVTFFHKLFTYGNLTSSKNESISDHGLPRVRGEYIYIYIHC